VLDILDGVGRIRARSGPEARAELLAVIERSQEVAQKLGDDLRSIPKPETEAARRASNFFGTFARGAHDRMVAEERRVRRLPANPTRQQSARALSELEQALGEAYVLMISVKAAIKQVLPELIEPYEKAQSCQELDELETRG
jgi:hypothetical protein